MRRLFVVSLAVGLMSALASCANSPVPQPSEPSPEETTPTPTPIVTPTPTPTPTPTIDPVVGALLASMTPEEKAGQLIMVSIFDQDTTGLTDALASIHAGSVLYLGSKWTKPTTLAISQMLNALPKPHGIGLYIAADQEGGQIQRLHGAGFSVIPSATKQAAMDDAALESAWSGWGAEMLAAGVNLNLAPVGDTVPADNIASNQPIGALGRYFSTDPSVNGLKVSAVVRGLSDAGVASAIKHFPGLGRITGNTDFTASGVVDDVTVADGDFITPFATGMSAHPTMVMVSLATYSQIDPAGPAALSGLVINNLLRDQLGWEGVVISDSLAAAAVADVAPADLGVRFITAGGDIAIIPGLDAAASAHAGLVTAMSDPAFAKIVDESLARVLLAKKASGLLS